MAGERTAALQDNLYELGELVRMFVFDFCRVRLESQGENIFAYNDRKQTAITISVRPANTRQDRHAHTHLGQQEGLPVPSPAALALLICFGSRLISVQCSQVNAARHPSWRGATWTKHQVCATYN